MSCEYTSMLYVPVLTATVMLDYNVAVLQFRSVVFCFFNPFFVMPFPLLFPGPAVSFSVLLDGR